jgi:hypothetical protein
MVVSLDRHEAPFLAKAMSDDRLYKKDGEVRMIDQPFFIAFILITLMQCKTPRDIDELLKMQADAPGTSTDIIVWVPDPFKHIRKLTAAHVLLLLRDAGKDAGRLVDLTTNIRPRNFKPENARYADPNFSAVLYMVQAAAAHMDHAKIKRKLDKAMQELMDKLEGKHLK